ncbi:MAG TPA: hypothetical protein VMS71_00990, partial [Candidatus Acidoferrum sp.]|nr:hypothetical protein [Candidatus Acidoferrum sp.]
MRAFYPLIFGVFVILLFGLFEILLLRLLNRAWWRHRRIRRIAWSLPIIGTVTVILWGLGEYYAKDWLSYPGALLTAVVFIFECGLMFSLPVSGAIHLLNSLLDRYIRHKHEVEPPVSAHRRLLLKGMAAATPIVTLGIGADGFVRAFAPVHVEIKPFFYPNLPGGLDRLKILHISDIHLRHYVTLADLERTVETARPFSPDLV